MAPRTVKARTINAEKHTVRADKPTVKVHEHKDANGAVLVTATEQADGTYKSSADGKVYGSLSAVASAYLVSQGKSGSVSGPRFFNVTDKAEPKDVTLANVRTLLDRALTCDDLKAAHKAALVAVRDAMPEPVTPSAKVDVKLADGRTVSIPARFLK